MKKTAQTLLTAAMFATALGSAASGSAAGKPTAFAADNPYFETPAAKSVTTDIPRVLYGPPWVFSTLEEEQQKTETTTTAAVTEDVTLPVTQAVYGPPLAFLGDMNYDGIADARDLTRIKQLALGQHILFTDQMRYSSDINRDGVVDADDVHLFMEEVLGIPEKEEPAVTTTAIETTAEVTTTATTRRGYHKTTAPGEVTLDPAILTGLIRLTDAPIIALYGPPSIDWDDQLRWDTYEDLHPGEGSKTTPTTTSAASKSKTTKTETVEEANRHKDS